MRIALLGLLAACGSVSDKHTDAAVHDTTSVDGHSDGGTDGATCAAKPASLVSRWRADMTAADAGPNHYDATPVGNVTYATGKYGQAFLLDGSTYLTISDSDALWPSGSFTLAAWVNTTHTGGDLLEKYACWNYCPSNQANALWVLALSGGSAQFEFRPDASGTIYSVTDTLHAVNDGQWHQLVGVRDLTASQMMLYVDGALAVSNSIDATASGAMTNADGETDLIAVGSSPTAGTSGFTANFNGALDELGYYNGALSAQQIAEIYNAPQGECP